MPRLTIIGLGYVGTSLGLALKARRSDLEIVGHDLDHQRMRLAQQLRAVDRTEWNLPAALSGAGLVVLAVPFRAITKLMNEIAPHLETGCVVTDTTPLKRPVLAAAQCLGPSASFIGGNPILASDATAQPSATAFRGRAYAIVAAASASDEAVGLVLRMVDAIGARPLILDAAEHDAYSAALDQLPALLATALFRSVTPEGAGHDLQELSGERFRSVVAGAPEDAAELTARWLANRELLLSRLEAFLGELAALGDLIREADAAVLRDKLAAIETGRAEWQKDRPLISAVSPDEAPTARRALQSLFWGQRRPRG